jgi:thioredoxin-like negative regulator of GroEL
MEVVPEVVPPKSSDGLNTTTFLLGLALSVVVVVGSVYLLNKYALQGEGDIKNAAAPKAAVKKEIEKSPYITDVSTDLEAVNALAANGKTKVVLVHAPWCGHCRNMMDDYVAAATADRSVEWYRIDSSVSQTVSRRQDLKGFPTIYGVTTNGTVLQHNRGRDVSSLMEFAKKVSNYVPTVPAEAGETVKAVTFNE